MVFQTKAFPHSSLCKRACRFIGINQNRCWERIAGKQQCMQFAKLPLIEKTLEGTMFKGKYEWMKPKIKVIENLFFDKEKSTLFLYVLGMKISIK